MRNIFKVLATVALALPTAASCSDDPDADNPSGPTEVPEAGSPAVGEGGARSADGGAGQLPAQAGAPAVGGSGGDSSVPTPPGGCNLDDLVDGGEVPKSGTLQSGHSYKLTGLHKVSEKLTIEPCVKVFGDTASKGTLVILPGAQLVAEGTADAPIVFTSSEPEGLRAPGDWGGVIVLGNGACNDATADSSCQIEGLTDGTSYGRTPAEAEDADSSGSLAYVRIEFPGVDLDGNGNEINGLTLGGVGCGTTLSHVMVSNTLDDCFEWFGGNVNADHLVAFNCGDDMFDTDVGYSGHVQFAFGRQLSTITSDPSGLEMDNDDVSPTKVPVTSPSFANVTLCGTGSEYAGAGPEVGMVLRRGVHANIVNAIVTGFFTAALSVRDTPATKSTLTSALQFGNGALFDASHDGGADWFTAQQGNTSEAPAGFGDCFGSVPKPFPAQRTAGVKPRGHADETASYVGAFADAADDWMSGAWIDWSRD